MMKDVHIVDWCMKNPSSVGNPDSPLGVRCREGRGAVQLEEYWQ